MRISPTQCLQMKTIPDLLGSMDPLLEDIVLVYSELTSTWTTAALLVVLEVGWVILDEIPEVGRVALEEVLLRWRV